MKHAKIIGLLFVVAMTGNCFTTKKFNGPAIYDPEKDAHFRIYSHLKENNENKKLKKQHIEKCTSEATVSCQELKVNINDAAFKD